MPVKERSPDILISHRIEHSQAVVSADQVSHKHNGASEIVCLKNRDISAMNQIPLGILRHYL